MSSEYELNGLNILLVDDDPKGLVVLEALLAFHGATTHTAWNGQVALELVQKETFDLVITDLSMPIMDGWQLAGNLKHDPATAHIPVVALTAHALDEYHQSAMEAGCDGVLTKPIQPDTLADELQRLLSSRSSASRNDPR